MTSQAQALYLPRPIEDFGVAPSWVRVLGFALILGAPFWFQYMFIADPEDLAPGTAYTLVPLLICLQMLLIFAASSGKGQLRQVMLVSALAKLFCVAAYMFMAIKLYSFIADTLNYFNGGMGYAHDVLWNQHWELMHPFWSNNAIYMLAGAVQVFAGNSFQTVAVLFAFISFWGEYFLYRGFETAFPRHDLKLAGLLIFFLPSILFWSAAVGKEAIITFFLGIAVYGAALLMRAITPWRPLALCAGVAGVGVIRPHLGFITALAFLFAWVMGKDVKGTWGLVTKTLTVPLLLAGTWYVASSATAFLAVENIKSGMQEIRQVGAENSYGGSKFGVDASPIERALAAPVLFFRPFPYEIRNPQAAIASGEGLLLLILSWKRRRDLMWVLKHALESQPALFVLAFLVIFSAVFSAAITNFGLLARERSVAVPMLAMLLCLRRPQRPAARPPAAPGPEYAR
jgi:hypothetical protein